MYAILLFTHSLFRWLVLISLSYATVRGYQGYASGRVFTKTDDSVRHGTATIAHIQLLLGATLYFQSPVIRAFFAHLGESIRHVNAAFFGVVHIGFMFVSIVVITIGSALAKRRATDREKFRTMAIWFSVALLLIFLAIPWPFSPWANRPYFRAY